MVPVSTSGFHFRFPATPFRLHFDLTAFTSGSHIHSRFPFPIARSLPHRFLLRPALPYTALRCRAILWIPEFLEILVITFYLLLVRFLKINRLHALIYLKIILFVGIFQIWFFLMPDDRPLNSMLFIRLVAARWSIIQFSCYDKNKNSFEISENTRVDWFK